MKKRYYLIADSAYTDIIFERKYLLLKIIGYKKLQEVKLINSQRKTSLGNGQYRINLNDVKIIKNIRISKKFIKTLIDENSVINDYFFNELFIEGYSDLILFTAKKNHSKRTIINRYLIDFVKELIEYENFTENENLIKKLFYYINNYFILYEVGESLMEKIKKLEWKNSHG